MRLLSALPIVLSLTSFLAAGSLAAQEVEPGSVITWGTSVEISGDRYAQKTPEEALSRVVAIAVGPRYAVAAKQDGAVVFSYSGSDWHHSEVLTNFGPIVAFAARQDPVNWLIWDHFAALRGDGSVVEFGSEWWNFLAPPRASLQSGVTAVAYSYKTLLAAKDDGTILSDGQPDPFAPVIPGGAKALAGTGGGGTALALRRDGTLAAWVPGTDQVALPIPLDAQSGVVAIAGGVYHFLALKANGVVVAWGGSKEWGELNVPPAAQSGVTAIAAGEGFSLALKADGTVVHWGRDIGSTGRVLAPVQGSVTAIAAGNRQALALAAPRPPTIPAPPTGRSTWRGQNSGLTVAATGPNLAYQWRRNGVNLAGCTAQDCPFPDQAQGAYDVVITNSFGSVTSAPPAIITVVPPAPGAVVAWGAGRYGTGGDDFLEYGQAAIPDDARSDVIAVAGGRYHSLALKADGTVLFWGSMPLYFSDGSTTEMPMSARSGATAIASSEEHMLVLKNDGSVIAWGSNASGEVDVPPAALSNVVAIAAGNGSSVALKADGSVVVWGSGGGLTNVPPAARSEVKAIADGGSYALALKEDGSVVAWGRLTNLADTARSGIVKIYAWVRPLGIKQDGSVVDLIAGNSEVPLAARTRVVDLASSGGFYHSAALKADGTVVTWGSDNTFDQLDVPAEFQGAVTGIAMGGYHTLAILGSAALQSKLTQDGIVLWWPTSLIPYHLQMTDRLDEGAVWIDVPETPVVVGNRQTVNRPVNSESRWYRLSR